MGLSKNHNPARLEKELERFNNPSKEIAAKREADKKKDKEVKHGGNNSGHALGQ